MAKRQLDQFDLEAEREGSAVRRLFAEAGFQNIETHRDLGDNERVTTGYIQ